MEKRPLGRTGLKIAPIVFGANVFGWTADEDMSYRLLDTFTDAGFNAIDTADIYAGEGGSETIIGQWLKKTGKRSQVVIATKVGGQFSADKKGLKKEYIIEQAEASLQRLQTDYIDLYQTHFDDPETPVEETMDALAELVKAGKVRAIGTSNLGVDRIADSLIYSEDNALPMYRTLQPEYNLFDREKFETEYQQFAIMNKMAVLPYFSLANGFLTGKYRGMAAISGTPREQLLGKYFTDRGFKILRALDEIAEQNNAQLATVALAWLMSREGVIAPIASATKPEQLEQLMAAATLKLGKGEIAILDLASAY